MYIGLISYKGGTGKSTSALHIAGALAKKGATLLIDGDANRTAIECAQRGPGMPFDVIGREEGEFYRGDPAYVVIDSEARPEPRRLKAIVGGCQRLIVTTGADAFSMAALKPTIADLNALGAKYSILLTMVSPVGHAGQLARQAIEAEGLPVFKTAIRRYSAYQKAALAGKLVCDVSDDYAGEAWGDYIALTRELLK